LRNKSKLLRNAIRSLLGGGYGLAEDQLKVVDEVLHTFILNSVLKFWS